MGVRFDRECAVERLLVREYGAVFVTASEVVRPAAVLFRDAAEVESFQAKLATKSVMIGDHRMELQQAAMEALELAIEAAANKELTITPRGADSARRTYDETVELWSSRVEPALKHWTMLGRLKASEAVALRGRGVHEQVREVLRLEEDRIYFAKDLSKSIIYSVAPPGASQHLAMLAFDVSEFNDPEVRAILAEHGWFQTVTSDLPHFTYLGVSETDLPGLGLKLITSGGRAFWVPDM
ncbi:MAG: D-alanyl-D-alanine carboxypeptidase family protein [Blastocatellia bacterium]|nr:D-alanyl-D-alanine carboxypeptidase family protein [Blastocatellia bacterium]